MPHPTNVQTLAELLFRAEHLELGIHPPFERLPQARQDLFRRRATFLAAQGVLAADAVAADVRRALGLSDDPEEETRVRQALIAAARGEVG